MRLLLLVSILSLSLHTFATDKPSVIQAASETTLAERIAKTYVLRAFDPGNSMATEQYRQAIDLFQKQLDSLRETSKDDKELADNYDLLAQQWDDFKKLSAASTTLEGAAKLVDKSDMLAKIAYKGSSLIEQRIGSDAKPVRIAEQVAALSQRLAKIYLMQSYGIKRTALSNDLTAARAEFDSLDKQLKALPNRNGSQARLSLLDSQWMFFQQAIEELANDNTDPQLRHNVVVTSEHIYEIAQTLASNFQPAGN